MTGLPIAASGTPLDRVPRPTASYSAPAFEVKNARAQQKSNPALFLALGLGAAVLIVLIVLIVLL